MARYRLLSTFGKTGGATAAAIAVAAIMAIICADSSAYAAITDPPRIGTMKKFVPAAEPQPAPGGVFTDSAGGRHTLAEFRGKVVLVNFWATWCGPCVEEMPSLQRLHARLKDPGFAMMAISEDRLGWKKILPFRDRHGLKTLPLYHDERLGMVFAARVKGLPTTLLVGRNGLVLGRLTGPADWDSPAAIALIKYYLHAGKGD